MSIVSEETVEAAKPYGTLQIVGYTPALTTPRVWRLFYCAGAQACKLCTTPGRNYLFNTEPILPITPSAQDLVNLLLRLVFLQ